MSKFDFFEFMDDFDGFYNPDEEEVRDKYVKSPFGWPGGKTESLKYLLAAIPYRRTDVESCGGSAVFSLNRDSSKLQLQIFNDRNSGITSFYKCLQDRDKVTKLIEWLELSIHSRELFLWCKNSWENCEDDIERAARWYYMLRMSFSQLGRNFGRATKGRGQHPQLIHNTLPEFLPLHDRIKKWQVENLDCIQCLLDYDSYDTVNYIDPDYIDTDPGIYKHKVDHKRLLECIFSLKGYVALSGYANPLYDSYKWDDRLSWKVPVTVMAQAFTKTNHLKHRELQMERTEAEEVLWIKY